MVRHALIECRGEKSRQEVANDVGITPQMLGYLERGDRNPSWNLAKKISVYYKKSVEELFFNQSGNVSCPIDDNSA